LRRSPKAPSKVTLARASGAAPTRDSASGSLFGAAELVESNIRARQGAAGGPREPVRDQLC
jgi:hypothetical protein